MIPIDDKPDDKRLKTPAEVRKAIFKVLNDNQVQQDVGIIALGECLGFELDLDTVRALARELGLDLSDARSDEDVEIYCNVRHNGRSVGFLYKGWGDPGFGLGESVPIPADSMILFEAQAEATLFSLASNGMGVTFSPMDGGGRFLDMTTVIYQDGFNAKTVAAALETLTECTERVRKLVA